MPLTITQMYAFVAKDRFGDEGIMAFQNASGHWMPMVGADSARIACLAPLAAKIAQATGIEYRILLFDGPGKDVTEEFK